MAEIKIPYLQDVTPAKLLTLIFIIVLIIILVTKFIILKQIWVVNPPAGIIP